MGFGKVISRYEEKKRVVANKNIGPLIATEMTRCIHCTRCVRFGQEVAGQMELGGTGRGEHMRIGTYVEQSVESELSGNMIDLCPVGALTSKPFRFTARSWELLRQPSIAPHDCVGSNLELDVVHGKVMRALPRENEAINEIWLSDRDRFSYIGLNSPDRLAMPLVKDNGAWREAAWPEALSRAAEGLREVAAGGAQQLGALAAPTQTSEELYLLQRLIRGLGSNNVDHRLRELDISDQHSLPLYPGLASLAGLEQRQSVLLVGSNIRKDQPLIGQRLRKAWRKGELRLAAINPVRYDHYFDLEAELIGAPGVMARDAAAVLKALLEAGDASVPSAVAQIDVSDAHRTIAKMLTDGESTVLLGSAAVGNADAAPLRTLARAIAQAAGGQFGELSFGGNGAGAWLAGCLPHRTAGGTAVDPAGLSAGEMFNDNLSGYLLLGVEPRFDLADPLAGLAALEKAQLVVALTAYRSPDLEQVADVLLPIAPFSETAGTFVNAEGRQQRFDAALRPLGEARPAWKVLRVLGNDLGLQGFGYNTLDEIRAELDAACADSAFEAPAIPELATLPAERDLERIGEVPLYRTDAVVRRAGPLQAREDTPPLAVYVNEAVAGRLGLAGGGRVRAIQGEARVELDVVIDARIADGCAYIPAAVEGGEALGSAFGTLRLEPA